MKRLLLIALLLTTCLPQKPPPVVVPPGAATCADVCHNLTTLGCPAARPTAKGVPCETVCANVQDSGVITWDLACRAHAATCAAVDRCP